MYRKFGNALMILALLGAMGAHWSVLQSIAWTTMLADNLGSRCSFSEAVQKTFDGEHPCRLCKAIAAGKKSEEKKDFTSPLQRLEYPLFKESLAVIAPLPFPVFPRENLFSDSVTSPPPTPPPRSLFI